VIREIKNPARVAVLACMLLILLSLRPGSLRAQDDRQIKVILRKNDTATHQTLLDLRGRPIADYGAYALWTLPERARLSTDLQPTIEAHPEFETLLLREGVLYTDRMSSTLDATESNDPDLHLVQFVGPIRDEWLVDLQETGADVIAYVPYNGYVVWADASARMAIARRVVEDAAYAWHGPYRPEYRLASALARMRDTETDVTVQLVAHPEVKHTVEQLVTAAYAVLQPPYVLGQLVTLALCVPAAGLDDLALRPDVFNIEPYATPHRLDERQGQIIAGVLTTDATQPSGPGYLSWLDSLGVSHDPADYSIVDVIDDGFDNGQDTSPAHPDFYGPDGRSRVAYARDLTTDDDPHGPGGHGTLNLSIVGGYDQAHRDAAGYLYGLGISPYTRLASTKVFNDAGNWDLQVSLPDLMRGSYRNGARIANVSWGWDTGTYDANAQAFDALTRDADASAAGNQPLLYTVSAGNAWGNPDILPGHYIASPGTAKNVITVGASENYRPTGVDGCGWGNNLANNAQDIASFSSHGPTPDGRAKPDLVAPGTHVQGAAAQDPAYDANGVCDLYYPAGQSRYTWSSGASHAAPAVAGALSLLYERWPHIAGSGSPPPSPAMGKAYLINAARYIRGDYGGGSLPGEAQGWGRIDLGMALDGVPRMLVDQNLLLRDSGQVVEISGLVADPTRPFRVTLAWTDAPGTTTAAAWVNDLNLEVTVAGQTYRGNVFSGSGSTTGGSADARNNVENVFLPPGMSGPFRVRVTAFNIAGDGVPGNNDPTDQDLALVVYNGVERSFYLTLDPAQAFICRPAEITYTLRVSPALSYPQSVTLTPGNPPSQTSLTLTPTVGVPTFDAALRVTTTPSTFVGTYILTVTGTAVHSYATTATLAVDAAPPLTPSLLVPADGASGIDAQPTFAWSTVPNARSYRVQVSPDADMRGLIVDARTSSPTYTLPTTLDSDSTFHWHVIAENGCGASPSATATFTTARRVALFYDSVEGYPNLWHVDTPIGTTHWTVRQDRSHSPSHAWHVDDATEVTAAHLESAAPIPLGASSELAFWHWHDMEELGGTAWDGGAIEISLDSGAWQDLGPHITQGGYDRHIPPGLNPLQGRDAWGGTSSGWQHVVVDLSAYAGSSVRFRFTLGADQGNVGTWEGWYVDDVSVTTLLPPSRYRVYLSPVFTSR